MAILLAVFGFGNIGQAVVEGARSERVLAASEILVVEPDDARRAIARALGCEVSTSAAAARDVTNVLLAVKPQSFPALAPTLGDRSSRTILISVMAGLRSERIRDAVGKEHAVVRAMPNTPCKVRQGMTAIALGAGAIAGDETFAARIFSAIGRVVRVDEAEFDAVTAVSGSGPAYVFLLAEAWEDAAISLGFDRTTARELVRQTILGAAAMLADRSVDAADLRAAVTSKGGTTAAALAVLEARGLRETLRAAITAAEQRGRDLGMTAAQR
ncbi:MAG: pyrroline-5-carboxylate reductase [Phycisphaerae bacterium]|nr:pyrroline-5-carboxylate reductase [Phycisphaerae bacterium]